MKKLNNIELKIKQIKINLIKIILSASLEDQKMIKLGINKQKEGIFLNYQKSLPKKS